MLGKGQFQRVRWTFIVCAFLAVALLVTACGGNKGNNAAPSSSAPASSSAASSEAASEAPVEPVTISFWAKPLGLPSITEWFEKWTAEFNRTHPHIIVDLQWVPGDAWDAKLKAAQATGTAPQVLYQNYTNPIATIPQGLLLPLDDYVDPAIWDDLFPNIESLVSSGGKHYLLPQYAEPYSMLFYRKDLFREAGLDPDKPPTSWAELYDYAARLTDDDTFGLGIAAATNDLAWTTWAWQAIFGKDLLNDDWSASNAKEPEFAELIRFYKSLYDAGSVPKQALGLGFWDVAPLAEGRVAMQFNGSWAIGSLQTDYAATVPYEEIGIALAPTPDGNQSGTVGSIGGWGFVIDGRAANPHEAGEYISWMLAGDPQMGLEFAHAVANSKFAVRKSVNELILADPAFSDDPLTKVVMEQVIPNAKPEPIYPYDISWFFATAAESVVISGTSVEDAIAKLDKDIAGFIAERNLAGTNPRQ